MAYSTSQRQTAHLSPVAVDQDLRRSKGPASSTLDGLAGDLNQRPAVETLRGMRAGLNQSPQVVAQAKLAATLSSQAGRSMAAPVQRYFDANHPSEITAVEGYVEAVRPDLMPDFREADASEDAVDLHDWLAQRMRVTMHDVYDWEDGIVRGRPLMIGQEVVRGSNDVPFEADAELDEFNVGLGEAEYTNDELEQLHHLLRLRDAPHDRRRRELLSAHVQSRTQQSIDELVGALDEDDIDQPYFSETRRSLSPQRDKIRSISCIPPAIST